MNRSSIFNFESLSRFKPTAAFWCCVGILVVARFGLWLSKDALRGWAITPRPYLQKIIDHGRDKVPTDLAVATFGSSRTLDGFDGDTWSQLAQLRRDQVANFSLAAGGIDTALHIAKEIGGLPKATSVVLIDVEPWMFNRGFDTFDPEGKRDDEYRNRGFFLGKAVRKVFPTERYRRSMDEWLERMISSGQGKKVNEAQEPVRPGVLVTPVPGHEDVKLVAIQFKDVSWSAESMNELRQLIAMVSFTNRQVILFHPPVRKDYLEAINADARKKAFFQYFQAQMFSLESSSVKVLFWKSTSDCGLTDDIYSDYGHATKEGRKRLTQRVYEALQGPP